MILHINSSVILVYIMHPITKEDFFCNLLMMNLIKHCNGFLTQYLEIYVSSLQKKLQTSLGNYLHKLFQKLVFLD